MELPSTDTETQVRGTSVVLLVRRKIISAGLIFCPGLLVGRAGLSQAGELVPYDI